MKKLSRNIIRNIILNEMRRKPPLTSGLTFDDDKTINIDDTTEIGDLPVPSFVGDDFDFDLDDFEDDDLESEDDEFVSRRMTMPDIEDDTEEESDTEYNMAGQITGKFGSQIRADVTARADEYLRNLQDIDLTTPDRNYSELLRQFEDNPELFDVDPEFANTEELERLSKQRAGDTTQIREHINKIVRQSIKQRLLLN